MQQWFEESSYDVIASCTANDDGTWQAMAVFSGTQSRGAYRRPLSTCQWGGHHATEEEALHAAMERARMTARSGQVSVPGSA